MKRHNFDKLAVYTEGGTTWMMVYMVGILNAYVLFDLYRLLTAFITPEISQEMMKTLSGGKAGFALAYLLFLTIDLAVAVASSILLPSLTPLSFYMFFAHVGTSVAVFPLTMLLTSILHGRAPKGFTLANTLFFLAWLVFSIINVVYFAKRREIFYSDIVRMVTGREKDPTKH